MWSRIAPNSWSSYISLLGAGVTAICQTQQCIYIHFYVCMHVQGYMCVPSLVKCFTEYVLENAGLLYEVWISFTWLNCISSLLNIEIGSILSLLHQHLLKWTPGLPLNWAESHGREMAKIPEGLDHHRLDTWVASTPGSSIRSSDSECVIYTTGPLLPILPNTAAGDSAYVSRTWKSMRPHRYRILR